MYLTFSRSRSILIMERKAYLLAPEWLRSNGSDNGSTKTRQTTPSLANSDVRIASTQSDVSSTWLNGSNIGRSSVSNRTTSVYFRHGPRNSSYSNPRSNVSYDRINRDTEWNKDKSDSRNKDNGYSQPRRVYTYPSGNRFDKDSRHLYSNRSGIEGEAWVRKGSADTINGYKSTSKPSFRRDFPSLGAESRQGTQGIRRVSSSGLTTLIKSLPSDKWTSALAEVPVKDGILWSPLLAAPNPFPQLPTKAWNVEEHAVKQSPQLVPITNSMPKASVHDASELLKPKVGQQMQISSSLQSNHLSRGAIVKPDVSKTSSTEKLLVSKTELPSSTAIARSSTPLASVDQKPTPILEKRRSGQAKSRNDFFNLMRKKSLETPEPALSASDLDNDGDAFLLESFVEDELVDKENEIEIKGGSAYFIEKSVDECGNECSRFKAFSYSEEKEEAFLCSLGWVKTEEDEDGGLTKEEINAFYKDLNEKIKSRPSSRSLEKMQLKFS